MKPISTLRLTFYSLIIVAASIGAFVYWQISSYPKEFNNIAFVFAYALMLIFVSIPLSLSETISGFLSKKTLTGSLHYVSHSRRLRFIGLLSLTLAALLLILVSTRMSTISTSLVYTSLWYISQSPEKPLFLIDHFTLVISLVLSSLIVLVIWLAQTRQRFLNLACAFSTLGLTSLVGLFIMNTLNIGSATSHFFTPNFQLLSLIDVWGSALSLALFSSLIGLGINSVLGTHLNAQCPIRRFSWMFAIGSMLAVILIMLMQNSQLNSGRLTSGILSFQSAYTLNLLAFGMFFFCLLTAAILLCQTFKGLDTSVSTHKWYVYLPLFILLLAAVILYQHLLAKTAQQIIQSELILNLIFVIAYVEILAFGWICDAQKLSYQLHKATNIKLSAIYNLSLRLIAPGAILTAFIQKILSIWLSVHWITMTGIFLASLIFTVILGSFLHRRFQ
ncbi:hypothetical protein [Caedibacter taeniospiralis]|uniref:hypothetical protein n=1 Tax=Caedibacter taeniospiralis TaxID=28907 RepID=UPI0037C0E0FD